MAAERIIGVDFGTSTSVVRVKRYENGAPAENKLDVKPVVFNMGSTMVPTLVRKTETDTFYGYNAEVAKKDSVLHQSFKVLLESGDPAQRESARAMTAEYLKYLAETYWVQSDGGHLGDASDREQTIISYPVKWSNETKLFMIEAARAAGFANVTGMDEANAAITAVILQNEEMLKKNGYLKAGVPLHILLLDMGAGTTDLVLCRHTPGKESKTEILCTYPKTGDVLFGGREVDALLGQFITDRVPEEYRSTILKKIGLEKYKAWKETIVSHSLKNNESVEEFNALDELAEMLEFDVDIHLDKSMFEDLCRDYLTGLPKLINGCLNEAKLDGRNIDLVILTGGHSQWYFVREIIAGINKNFGSCGLTKIEADQNRIVSIALPQETVALGLAFSKMKLVVREEQPKPVIIDDSTEAQRSFRLVVEKVYTLEQGTVVTGEIKYGTVVIGDSVDIVCPGEWKKPTVIDNIQKDRTDVQEAKAKDRVGLLLKDISSEDVKAGYIVCNQGWFITADDSIQEQSTQFEDCWGRILEDLKHQPGNVVLPLNGQTFHTAKALVEDVNSRGAVRDGREEKAHADDVLLFCNYTNPHFRKLKSVNGEIVYYGREYTIDRRFILTSKNFYKFSTTTSYFLLSRNDYTSISAYPISQIKIKIELGCSKDTFVYLYYNEKKIDSLTLLNPYFQRRPRADMQKDWDRIIHFLQNNPNFSNNYQF